MSIKRKKERGQYLTILKDQTWPIKKTKKQNLFFREKAENLGRVNPLKRELWDRGEPQSNPWDM